MLAPTPQLAHGYSGLLGKDQLMDHYDPIRLLIHSLRLYRSR